MAAAAAAGGPKWKLFSTLSKRGGHTQKKIENLDLIMKNSLSLYYTEASTIFF